jgi:signal transduction histidine kinase
VPPNLDPIAQKTSRLHLLCPAPLLDALPGVAGLLDTHAKWFALSRYWDRLMNRANRPEWSRDALREKPLYELFPDAKQQAQLKKVFASLAQGNLEQHSQTVEFGTGARALHVEMMLRPLSVNGTFAGVLVQLLDVTREHLNRIALLDRERKMRELQERTESQTTDYAEAMARRTLEHSRDMTALHEEIERLSTEQATQMAETKETFEVALRQLGDKPAQQMREFSELVARMAGEFRQQPQDFSAGLCRVFKDVGASNFSTLYVASAGEHEFVLCDHCDAPEVFHLAAEHGFIRLAEGEGTVGLSAVQSEPVKFSHLLDSADYGPWAHIAEENGYNCLWAIPLRMGGETCGVMQLYYREEDARLSEDQQAMLSALAQAAAPLLKASHELAIQPSKNGAALHGDTEDWRSVIGELAEEYGNLLTGVLGHSTLAAAELGETHAAREDLRAIERAARTAAKLTRRLAALSGAKEKATVVELGAYVQRYLEQHRLSSHDKDHAALPVVPCEVRADVSALEVILDGIVEYAWQSVSPEAAPLWTLMREDRAAHLTLLFDAPPNPPVKGPEKRGESVNGKGTKRAAHGKPRREEPVNGAEVSREPLGLRLSREVARALGGEIEVNSANGQTAMVLTLPVEEGMRAEA